MAIRRDPKTRKIRDEAKTSLIDKVNSKDEKSSIPKPSEQAKSSLVDKVNSSDYNGDDKKNMKRKKDNNKVLKRKKESKFFFFKLSKIGRLMLLIYIIGGLVFGFMVVQTMSNKGKVILGERENPTAVISEDSIPKVKSKVEQAVSGADSVEVSLKAFRLVVVIDLADSTSSSDGEQANKSAYDAVNSVLPISTYFNSTGKLNNDLFIYSTDKVPTKYEKDDSSEKSKYIYQTYKNSKMKEAKSYNLMKPRDKKSRKEVEKTLK